jgi:P-type Ca2+ transporter type 2C
LLALAAIVSAFLGEYVEAIAIASILLINAIIGFVEERKAGDAIAALKKLSALKVKVLRDGAKQLIDADQIVVGDIIYLETGDKVPADGRVIEVHNGQVLESALTGESTSVSKLTDALEGKRGLGDQKNMVFSGSVVTAGRITAVITSTGMQTELGKVATMLASVEEQESPLQQKVDAMVHKLSVVVLGMALTVFLVLLFTLPGGSEGHFEALITAVALAVAALPEGLPIILTITSAIGVKRMVKKHVLIRKLMSVETLGSVTVICTDKTGTLTKNQMTVQHIYVNGAVYSVTGDGYEENGDVQAPASLELTYLLTSGALCNNASFYEGKITGDPTELALIVSALKAGLDKDELEKKYSRTAELEFTSERKLMSTVHELHGKKIQFTKGAIDVLLHRCTSILEHGELRSITEADKEKALSAAKTFSTSALRVLGFAYKEVDGEATEDDLIFVGLQAMMDPPREEVKIAIDRCKQAGIKVIMITGDHPDTAAAVAEKLGLEVKVLTGKELDALENIDSIVEDIIIYARVNPEHKLRIVTALQRKGHVVAMTGDGVNDAPALKKADIGVAMGITGTDVAKEASQMIITDDNFASIVNAVEEGRSLYDNIKRFVRYQLSTNIGAILIIILSILIRLPLPLLPLQLLWINLSIDGPPALSLGLEPSTKGVLQRKPRPRTEPLITRPLLIDMIVGGIVMAVGTLLVFAHYDNDYAKATTMAFTTFTFFQFFNVLNCRSRHFSIFSLGLFTNTMAIVTILVMTLLHVAIIYVPFLQGIFNTVALTGTEWLIAIATASTVLIAFEIKKFFVKSA